jgi:hypothetical protein
VEPRSESHVFHAKPPKHNFPKFSGKNPLLWIDLAYTYFDMYSVQHHQWLSTATLYLEDHATLWFQTYKRHCHSPTWDQFVAAVIEEFGQDELKVRCPSSCNSNKRELLWSTSWRSNHAGIISSPSMRH